MRERGSTSAPMGIVNDLQGRIGVGSVGNGKGTNSRAGLALWEGEPGPPRECAPNSSCPNNCYSCSTYLEAPCTPVWRALPGASSLGVAVPHPASSTVTLPTMLG